MGRLSNYLHGMNIRGLAAWGGGNGKPFVYLLKDEFVTNDNNPLTSPRTCEPGPGTLTIVDTNKLSISGGKVVKATGGGFRLYSDSITRKAGIAFSVKSIFTTSSYYACASIGISQDGSALKDGIVVGAYTPSGYDNGVAWWGLPFAATTELTHEYLTVMLAQGSMSFVRGGNYGKWMLVFPSLNYSGDGRFLYKPTDTLDTGYLDDAAIVDLSKSPLFSSRDQWAQIYEPTPVSGFSGVANRHSLIEFNWTPAAEEVLEIKFNVVDASNYNVIRCTQATGRIICSVYTGGTETVRQNAAQVWTVGSPYRILIWNLSQNLSALVNANFVLNCNVTYANKFGSGYSISGFANGADFVIYPQYITNLPAPYDFSGYRWILGIGDSKMAASIHLGYLAESLPGKWCINAEGYSGYSVAGISTIIDNIIASQTETPEIIWINLGSNDLSSLPVEATLKTKYRNIISACHTKWPLAQIYLEKPVRLNAVPPSTPVASVATLHAWIDDLVAEQTYLHTGGNEVNFENGDGYVTYLNDITHPKQEGYKLQASWMKTLLGY